jgi:hypothetical protein
MSTTQPTPVCTVCTVASHVEISGQRSGFVMMSLDLDDLASTVIEMAVRGEKPTVCERQVRVMGLTVPVFVLISR